jgi:hypothetical protein
MDQNTRNALYAFVQNLTHSQAAALMDVLGSYVQNVECVDEADFKVPSEFRFVKAVSDYVALQVASIPE